MPRTGVCAAGWVLLLAALLGGCGEGEVVQPRPSELAADTVTVSEEAAARLRRGHYADVHDLAQALSLPTAFARSEALHALVSRSDARRLAALLDEAAEIADPAHRRLARRVLYLRFTELDAGAAARRAAAESPPESHELLQTVFGDWARRDLDGALAGLQTFSRETDLQRSAATGIVDAHAWRGSHRAAAVLSRLPEALRTPHVQGSAVAANAESDPAGAFEQALELEDREARETALSLIVRTWAEADPEAAFARVRQLDDGRLRNAVMAPATHAWAKQDPEGLWAAAGREDNQRLRTQMQTAALGTLVAEDTDRALELAAGLPASARQGAYYSMLSRLAQTAPERAADAVLGIAEPQVRKRVARSIMGTLVSRDIDEALVWAERVEGQRGDIWLMVLRQAARNDPLVGLNRAAALGDPDERARALMVAISGAADTDPDLAAGYIAELPAGPKRSQAVLSLVNGLATADPRAAMEIALARPADEREKLLRHVSGRMVTNHPEIAAQYLARLNGKERTAWLTAMANQKGADDPAIAAAWLEGYQGDPDFDRIATALTGGMSRNDPETALAIARRIGDEALRSHALARVAGAMASAAPENAIAIYERMPVQDRSPQLVEQMVRPMVRADPQRTAQWVGSFSETSLRDTGYAALAAGIGDLDRSLDYVRRITTDEMKMRALVPLLMQNGRDPDSVDRILGGAGLSPEVAEELRDEMRRRFPMGLPR